MKTKAWFLILALLLIGFVAVVWHEAARGSQYRLGMTIAEARSLTAGRYPTQRFGLDYDGQPTLQQMNDDALYYIFDESSGMLLMFNHHERLIQKKRVKWFGVNLSKLTDSLRKPD